MNLNDILEAEGKQLVIIYPGRFHPFHIGHGKVYKYLKQKYSNAKVFIATSGKVDGDRSPFTFDEKRKMMILAGVDASAIVQTKSPYQSIEIMERFDKDTTVVVFAVSEKDMAEDPRFDFSNGLKLKKNGEPAYLQKWNNLNDAETFGTHGYIATTPTFPFEVLGQKINSASQIRNMISQSDDTKLTQLLQDLYSVTDVPQDVIELFKNKIGNTETMNENWDEHSFSEYLKENVIEDNIMKDSILKALTEGKSPHKKGTKKYKAHMAAMHAESIDEEFDRKVKEVLEAKTNETDGNDQQSKLEYIHMALSASKDGDLTFDEMTAGQALEYVKEIKVEREEDKKKLSYISTTLSASIDEDSYFDEQMADQALEYVEDIIERPLDEETVKEGGYHNEQHEQLEYIHHVLQECGDGNMDITMVEQAIEYVEDIREQHFNTEGSTKSESVNEEEVTVDNEGNIAGYLDTIDEYVLMLFKNKELPLAHKNEVAYRIQNAVDDIRTRELGLKPSNVRASYANESESVNEADVDLKPIEGSFDWANSMSDGTLKTLKHAMNNDWDMLDGIKDLADFKRTIDIFFTNEETPVPEDIAKIFNKLLARDEKNIAKFNEFIRRAFIDAGEELEELDTMFETTDHEVNEWVQDSPEKGFSGQERNFIQELCLRMDGISKTPNGLQWQGKSKTWDEGNVLSDKGKLTTVMLWAKRNVDDLYSRMGSEFQVYSDGNDKGESGRGQSDGNQIIQNIIKKIGTVNEDWEDVTPKGYGPDDYDEKDVAPEHNGELDKMQDLYKHNEDRNNHSGNIEMLAQAFGNRDEIKAIEGLLKIIKRQGYTTPEQSDMMYKAIHKKYYSQLFPETETEGNKFSGELKKAKIDGKKSFDVDGKTYKVKEALSKLLDKQKI